jgi:transcriptional regulator GlxA family with amidase domain
MKVHHIFLILILSLGCLSKDSPRNLGEMQEVHAGPSSFETANNRLKDNRYNVALLLIDGTYNTELTAAMDIFHHTEFREGIKRMNAFTVSNTYDVVTTFEGLRVLPDFNYLDTLPQIDILVIPAAAHNLDSDLTNKKLVDFIRTIGAKADYVCSHCDGAFLLAKTGLLDERVSTTFPGDVEEYRIMYPHLEVVEDVVLVHDGKFITSAGGAQTFEASIYLTELIYGKKVADELAEGMVINWDLSAIEYLRVED